VGKRKWRPYNVGAYRLGQLGGEAVAVWSEPGGKRPRFRLGVRTEAEGRAALARFARANDRLDAVQTQRVDAIWTAYIADRERDGKGMLVYHHNWKALAPVFGCLTADEITEDLCRAYARQRFEAGRKPATVNTELARLSQALKWAHERHIISLRPKVWIPSAGEPRQRVLTEDEVLAILDGCATPHVRLFLILLICTGGRHHAIVELTWDRVDFAAGTINLKAPRVVEPMSKRHQKGRAIVPMNDLARAALLEAHEGAVTDFVLEYRGARLTGVKDGFAAACARAGIRAVTPHTIRHSVASWQWEKVSPEQVARFLGHKTVKTTERVYAKPSTDFLTDAAEVVNLQVVRRTSAAPRTVRR